MVGLPLDRGVPELLLPRHLGVSFSGGLENGFGSWLPLLTTKREPSKKQTHLSLRVFWLRTATHNSELGAPTGPQPQEAGRSPEAIAHFRSNKTNEGVRMKNYW